MPNPKVPRCSPPAPVCVGTVPAYRQAHMDLLDRERPVDLDDPAWPVLGRAPHRLPAGAVVAPGGRFADHGQKEAAT